jgi:hypothetical protein
MAKKMSTKSNGYKSSIRNRGEDIGQASRPGNVPYDNNPDYTNDYRPIQRKEIRDITGQMYRDEQERDQRSLDRVNDARNEFYAGLDPRRRREVADSGMVQEDHNAIANLSPIAIHREYPKAGYYSTPYWDDMKRGGPFFSDDNNTLG